MTSAAMAHGGLWPTACMTQVRGRTCTCHAPLTLGSLHCHTRKDLPVGLHETGEGEGGGNGALEGVHVRTCGGTCRTYLAPPPTHLPQYLSCPSTCAVFPLPPFPRASPVSRLRRPRHGVCVNHLSSSSLDFCYHQLRCCVSLPPGPPELHLSPDSGAPGMVFVRAAYSIETSDAERIGVDQVARILPSGKATGSEQRELSVKRTVSYVYRSLMCKLLQCMGLSRDGVMWGCGRARCGGKGTRWCFPTYPAAVSAQLVSIHSALRKTGHPAIMCTCF